MPEKMRYEANSLQRNKNFISPQNVLEDYSKKWNIHLISKLFALKMDEIDPLRGYQQLFAYPLKKDLPNSESKYFEEDEHSIYLCGQSLGLKPKVADKYCLDVLDNWSKQGVHSHFRGKLAAAICDSSPKNVMSKLVGCEPSEISIMNALTVNLHILLLTFYRPNNLKHKIVIEENAFSSDLYMVESQLYLHGYTPENSLIKIKPRKNEYILHEEDIIKLIEEEGDTISLILLPGIQYYTGQLIDFTMITKTAHEKNILVGMDAAHSVGNVELHLHDWDIDFAAWCTYKYLNAGAGCIGAIFVNQRLTEKGSNKIFPMVKGWWGNNIKTKFQMKKEFESSYGADMFRISNPSPLLIAPLMASLEIFDKVNMDDLRNKQLLLTGYLEYLLKYHFSKDTSMKKYSNCNCQNCQDNIPYLEIITPSDPNRRGSQLSVIFSVSLSTVQIELEKRGVTCDIRMPSVMRIAPVPLYNSFTEVYLFVDILQEIFNEIQKKSEQKCYQNANNHLNIHNYKTGQMDNYKKETQPETNEI